MEFIKAIIFNPVSLFIVIFILTMGFLNNKIGDAFAAIAYIIIIMSPVIIKEIFDSIRQKFQK